MEQQNDPDRITVRKPAGGRMNGEVALIVAILVGWGALPFGFQLLVRLLADQQGQSFLTRFVFFNLPFHFWFTGQFLPLWFIILCVIFNVCIDRLSEKSSRRRNGFYE